MVERACLPAVAIPDIRRDAKAGWVPGGGVLDTLTYRRCYKKQEKSGAEIGFASAVEVSSTGGSARGGKVADLKCRYREKERTRIVFLRVGLCYRVMRRDNSSSHLHELLGGGGKHGV